MTLRSSQNQLTANNARPALYNADPSFMMNWRKAMTDVKRNAAHCTIACIGDSIFTGGYSDNNIAGLWNQAPPARLAAWLTTFGINAGSSSSLNNHALDASGSLTNFNHWDTRMSFGAGWASDPTAGDEAPGGFWWTNSTTTNAMAFTPGVPFDSVDLSYVNVSGLGTFTVDIDGVGSATVTPTGPPALSIQTVNKGSPGTTVNIKRVSGAVYVQGPICYQSAVKEAHVINYGDNNSFTASRLANSFAASQNAASTGAKLTLFSLGYHDLIDAGRTTAQLLTDLGTCITAAKTIGDVVLLAYNPFSTATVSLANQQAIQSTILQAGINNKCWVIDNGPVRNTSFAAYNTAGFVPGADAAGLHPNAAGIDDFQRFVASVLANV